MLLAAFGLWDWAVVVGYFVAVAVGGVWVSLRQRRAAAGGGEGGSVGYFLGGRSMPVWTAVVSIVASSLSAATFVGVPDLSFGGDLSYWAMSLGGLVSVLIVAVVFVPRLYAAGTVTIYGFLAQRYGEGARLAVSLTFLFGRMLASGARLFLAAIPLSLLLWSTTTPTTGQLVLAIVLIGGVVTVYTVTGGVRAVVWLDVLQLGVVVLAAGMTVAVLLGRIPLSVGEIGSLLASAPVGEAGGSKLTVFSLSTDPTRAFTLWTALIGGVLLSTASLGTDHDLAQRFLIVKSATRGAVSVVLSQLLAIVVVGLFLAIGLLLYVFYRRPDVMGVSLEHPATGVYPYFLMTQMPPLVGGLCIAGFFAIAQGSMDSAVNALAASAVSDVVNPLRRRLGLPVDESSERAGKWAVGVVGVTMCLFAIGCALTYDPASRTLLDFALGVMTFAFTGMLAVFLTALLTSRGSTWSVVAALVAGAATVALLQDSVLAWWSVRLLGAESPWRLAWPWWMTVGTAVAFAVCVMGRRAETERAETERVEAGR
ncbi:MAG: sodium:solute symporter family transporter [Tepidisphaerales bacterium]